jgi:hypothetical protein
MTVRSLGSADIVPIINNVCICDARCRGLNRGISACFRSPLSTEKVIGVTFFRRTRLWKSAVN